MPVGVVFDIISPTANLVRQLVSEVDMLVASL